MSGLCGRIPALQEFPRANQVEREVESAGASADERGGKLVC